MCVVEARGPDGSAGGGSFPSTWKVARGNSTRSTRGLYPNSFCRASSLMAMTAGCLSFRSTEMA